MPLQRRQGRTLLFFQNLVRKHKLGDAGALLHSIHPSLYPLNTLVYLLV